MAPSIEVFHRYKNLDPLLTKAGSPHAFKEPEFIFFNRDLFQEFVGEANKIADFKTEDLLAYFSGQRPLFDKSESDYAQVYAGHQFGHFNPLMGDGRALILGEIKNHRLQKYFEVCMKGSGPTPFSKRGDGFSALAPALREYIVSEFMHKMNIPTTRSLAVVKTNDRVQRESIRPAGILIRLSPSHLRIGTLQYLTSQKKWDVLEKVINYFLPEVQMCPDAQSKMLTFFEHVAKKNSELIAKWMSIGFIHGVMNTDNMLLSGDTLDYGPCAFMDQFNFHQVYSFIDRDGRYQFSKQPQILFWNLSRLADCLILYLDHLGFKAEEQQIHFQHILSKYADNFENLWAQELLLKLGIQNSIKSPHFTMLKDLVFNLLQILHQENWDYTSFFVELTTFLKQRYLGPQAQINDLNPFQVSPELRSWANRWSEVIIELKLDNNELLQTMQKINPRYIPRNHVLEQALKNAEAFQFEDINLIREALLNPCEQNPEYDAIFAPPRQDQKIKNTFCGT